MYKIVLAFDIHDDKGKSILQDDVPNSAEYTISREKAESLNLSLAVDRIESFLAHYYSTGFENSRLFLNKPTEVPGVWAYNYTLGFPNTHLDCRSFHSKIKGEDNTLFCRGTLSVRKDFLKNEDLNHAP